MKLRYTLILVGAVLLGGCSSPDIAEQKPQPDFSPHPAKFDAVTMVKGVFGQRSKSLKSSSGYGGAGSGEAAVLRSLRWFKKTQNEDGSWSTNDDPKAVATGLALLTFITHGETPLAMEFGSTFERAVKYLISIQNEKGQFEGLTDNSATEHAIITLALCDAYDLTRSPYLKEPCFKAVDVILKNQHSSGMWTADFDNSSDVDMDSSTWQITALKDSMIAGVEKERIRLALKKTIEPLKACIQENRDKTVPVHAVLCLQSLGYSRDEVCRNAIGKLGKIKVEWEKPDCSNPIYTWGMATQVAFRHGGEIWNRWNRMYAPQVVVAQIVKPTDEKNRRGHYIDIGYWVSPDKNERYGVIYATSLSSLSLQVYYQYRPNIFRGVDIKDKEEHVPSKDIEIEIDI